MDYNQHFEIENFCKRYVRDCLVEMYDHVRSNIEGTEWGFVSSMFTIDDVDYMREFRDYIVWERVKKEVLHNNNVLNEFKDLIDDQILFDTGFFPYWDF